MLLVINIWYVQCMEDIKILLVCWTDILITVYDKEILFKYLKNTFSTVGQIRPLMKQIILKIIEN